MHLEETVSSELSETIKPETDAASAISSGEEKSSMKTGIIAEQILEGGTGTIHYRYYLPVRTWTGMGSYTGRSFRRI